MGKPDIQRAYEESWTRDAMKLKDIKKMKNKVKNNMDDIKLPRSIGPVSKKKQQESDIIGYDPDKYIIPEDTPIRRIDGRE